MSGTVNKVILIGHLGEEVKIHYFDSENCVGRFTLATHETFINKKTNEKTRLTEWHHIVVKNKTAENCEKYLSKGDLVYVEGKIRTREWQSENGSKTVVEIHAQEVTFLNTAKQNSETKIPKPLSNESDSAKPGLPF
jgi:single-strand DNA-binding protein